MTEHIVLVFYPKDNDKAFIHEAQQMAGKKWPGRTCHLRVAELHAAGQVETLGVDGVIAPRHYDDVIRDHEARDIEVLQLPAATAARAHGPDRSIPPADDRDKAALIPLMMALEPEKVLALVRSIESIDFLEAMLAHEEANEKREPCVDGLNARLDGLR